MKKNEVLLETYFDSKGQTVYQITRNIMTGEYSFYTPDENGDMKKREKSYSGSFEKEKKKINVR